MSLQLRAYEHHTIDTVISYQWGKGQNTGQSEKYFPKNIFGEPYDKASETMPASSPEDICSLGLGGEIIVAFKGYEIVDAPGPDFTIFENVFLNPVSKKMFVEPAIISVSFDGINFKEFPYNRQTLIGCAGITPTNGNKDCYNPVESGGDKFDLAVLGIKRIRFIKIKDISQSLLDNPKHPYYDPIITGFDLDAVCGLHLKKISSDYQEIADNSIIDIRISGNTIVVSTTTNNTNMCIYNLNGIKIESKKLSEEKYFNLSAGIYFIIVRKKGNIIYTKKVLI